ncbi:hypothetical protein D1872_323240 [compost metagenome]
MVGLDPYLDMVPHVEALRCLHLHAAAGQVQAHCRDHLAFVQKADLGVDAHADEIAFLAMAGGRVGHAASFPSGCAGRLSYNSR